MECDVTVYTLPDCPACQLTSRALERGGVRVARVDLSTRPDLVAQFRAQGISQAPVVRTNGGQLWAGFRPDRIKEAITATTAARHAQRPARQELPPAVVHARAAAQLSVGRSVR